MSEEVATTTITVHEHVAERNSEDYAGGHRLHITGHPLVQVLDITPVGPDVRVRYAVIEQVGVSS